MTAWLPFWLAGSWSGDTQAPTVNIVSGPTRTRMSRVGTQDATDFTFSVDEAVTAWQVRLVPGTASPVTAGTLIESGGALAGAATQTVTVTDDELVAAGGTEGTHVVKVFARDAAGNWST